MKPTVGRIVHFYSDREDVPKDEPLPAIITRVQRARPQDNPPADGEQPPPVPPEEASFEVHLKVFHPAYELLLISALFSDKPKAECWSWPPMA